MSELANNLRKAMEEKCLDQPALEEKSGVGQGTISRILNDVGEARESTLTKLGKPLGLTAAQLRGYVVSSNVQEDQNRINKPMTSELIAKMYGINNMSIIIIIEKLLTLNNATNPHQVLSEIKLRLDILLEDLEANPHHTKIKS